MRTGGCFFFAVLLVAVLGYFLAHPLLVVESGQGMIYADVDAIAKIAKGKDAIISAYNPGWNNPDIAKLITENYPKILKAARESGVKRLLIVGGAGTLRSEEQV